MHYKFSILSCSFNPLTGIQCSFERTTNVCLKCTILHTLTILHTPWATSGCCLLQPVRTRITFFCSVSQGCSCLLIKPFYSYFLLCHFSVPVNPSDRVQEGCRINQDPGCFSQALCTCDLLVWLFLNKALTLFIRTLNPCAEVVQQTRRCKRLLCLKLVTRAT